MNQKLPVDPHSLVDCEPECQGTDELSRVAAALGPPDPHELANCFMRLRGRACEACAHRLEKKAEAIAGIRRASASFLGGAMSVTYERAAHTPESVLEQVRRSGAPVELARSPQEEEKAPRGTNWEAVLTAGCLIFMLAGWLGGSSQLFAAVCFALAYAAGGYYGVRAGWQSLRERTIDVDLLMVLAALGAAFIGHPLEGAMLLFLFSLSNVLQGYAIERSRRAIHSLMKLRPAQALVRRPEGEVTLPIEELVIGDIILVRPGESVPLDAVIVEGESSLNEASITGESMPVVKRAGDPVYAATINQTGGLEVRVTRLARDSTVERLIRMVEEAQSQKAASQRFLERAEQYYAMGVIGVTLALIALPPLFGEAFGTSFYRAMTLMVVASPCALIISTPASILSAIARAARRGVLFKGGAHLERAANISIVALDKTGTITQGKPAVTDLVPARPGLAAEELLRLAASVETRSEHPLARALVEEARGRGLELGVVTQFQSTSGKGASALVAGQRIAAGNQAYFDELNASWPEGLRERLEALQTEGKTGIIVGRVPEAGGAEILGLVAVADVLRVEAVELVRQLRGLGIQRIVMLTGDNQRVAAAIAGQAGITEFHAELLPEDKVRVLRELNQAGVTAMVGDGVNDAPALATAGVGIAMGAAGTDVAMETADVVLMGDKLANIPFAIALSRQARRVVRQNLVFALAVILVLIVSTLGWELPLPLGVVGHEGSTVLVCLNGLRLLAFRGPANP